MEEYYAQLVKETTVDLKLAKYGFFEVVKMVAAKISGIAEKSDAESDSYIDMIVCALNSVNRRKDALAWNEERLAEAQKKRTDEQSAETAKGEEE